MGLKIPIHPQDHSTVVAEKKQASGNRTNWPIIGETVVMENKWKLRENVKCPEKTRPLLTSNPPPSSSVL